MLLREQMQNLLVSSRQPLIGNAPVAYKTGTSKPNNTTTSSTVKQTCYWNVASTGRANSDIYTMICEAVFNDQDDRPSTHTDFSKRSVPLQTTNPVGPLTLLFTGTSKPSLATKQKQLIFTKQAEVHVDSMSQVSTQSAQKLQRSTETSDEQEEVYIYTRKSLKITPFIYRSTANRYQEVDLCHRIRILDVARQAEGDMDKEVDGVDSGFRPGCCRLWRLLVSTRTGRFD